MKLFYSPIIVAIFLGMLFSCSSVDKAELVEEVINQHFSDGNTINTLIPWCSSDTWMRSKYTDWDKPNPPPFAPSFDTAFVANFHVNMLLKEFDTDSLDFDMNKILSSSCSKELNLNGGKVELVSREEILEIIKAKEPFSFQVFSTPFLNKTFDRMIIYHEKFDYPLQVTANVYLFEKEKDMWYKTGSRLVWIN